jgi:hypothetical protein
MADASTNVYYFIKPSVSVASIGSALAIIIIGLIFLFTFISTTFKWEERKCKGSNFLLASAVSGESVSDTFGKCVKKAQTNSNSNDDSALTQLTKDLQTSVTALKTSIRATPTSTSPSTSASYTNLLGTVDTIQSALSKVLGSVVLTAKMNNGVLQSSNSLQNGELSQLINKYNTLGSNIQDQQATSASAGIS